LFNQSRAIRDIGMISKGKNPTALELKWRGIVADFARETSWTYDLFGNCLDSVSKFELDHFLGARAKRKVGLISKPVGELAILPIPYELHNVMSDHEFNKTLRPAAFRDRFNRDEILFQNMIDNMKSNGYEIPFSQDIINAIVRG
jgi:hypothetical protein